MIFTNMFSGVSRGTTAFDPLCGRKETIYGLVLGSFTINYIMITYFGNNELTILCKRECVAELDSHLIRIM